MQLNKLHFAQELISSQEADRPDIFQKEFGDIVELVNQIKGINLGIAIEENHQLISTLYNEARWSNRDIKQERK